MASWTNISAPVPGQLVSASTIDTILDNIEHLSIHDHSGSSGEGGGVLAGGAKISNTNAVGYMWSRPYNAYTIPAFFPASNNGWSRIIVDATISTNANLNAWQHHTAYLGTNDDTASGASVAFQIILSGSRGDALEGYHLNPMFRVGPDSGCVTASLINNTTGSTIATTTKSLYKSASEYAPQAYNIFAWSGNEGLHIVKMQVVGKDTVSSGYGASIFGFRIAKTN